jgi:hypothetical protein
MLLIAVKAAVAAGGSPTIIVTKVDRLGRDTVDVSQTFSLFESLGARIVFLDSFTARLEMTSGGVKCSSGSNNGRVAGLLRHQQAEELSRAGNGVRIGTGGVGDVGVGAGDRRGGLQDKGRIIPAQDHGFAKFLAVQRNRDGELEHRAATIGAAVRRRPIQSVAR